MRRADRLFLVIHALRGRRSALPARSLADTLGADRMAQFEPTGECYAPDPARSLDAYLRSVGAQRNEG